MTTLIGSDSLQGSLAGSLDLDEELLDNTKRNNTQSGIITLLSCHLRLFIYLLTWFRRYTIYMYTCRHRNRGGGANFCKVRQNQTQNPSPPHLLVCFLCHCTTLSDCLHLTRLAKRSVSLRKATVKEVVC